MRLRRKSPSALRSCCNRHELPREILFGRDLVRSSILGDIMWKKVILSLSVMPFLLIVPLLEISDTHVFNPHWPGHARLHEVWQLATNFMLGLLCLWLAWFENRVRSASTLGLLVTGGFLIAFVLRNSYGGSMRHTNGAEALVFGVNSAVLIMTAASLALLILALPRFARHGGRELGRASS